MGILAIVNWHVTIINYQDPRTGYKCKINLKTPILQTQKEKKKNGKVG